MSDKDGQKYTAKIGGRDAKPNPNCGVNFKKSENAAGEAKPKPRK